MNGLKTARVRTGYVGWWTVDHTRITHPSLTHFELYSCAINEKACPGSPRIVSDITAVERIGANEDTGGCREGGYGIACADCRYDFFYEKNEGCIQCERDSNFIVILLSLLLVVVMCILIYMLTLPSSVARNTKTVAGMLAIMRRQQVTAVLSLMASNFFYLLMVIELNPDVGSRLSDSHTKPVKLFR